MPWLVGGADRSGEPMMWSSDDVQQWTATPLGSGGDSVHPGSTELGTYAGSVIATGVSPDDETATWLSVDGATWAVVDREPRAELSVSELVSGPAGTLAFGAMPVTDTAYLLTVWRLDPR